MKNEIYLWIEISVSESDIFGSVPFSAQSYL